MKTTLRTFLLQYLNDTNGVYVGNKTQPPMQTCNPRRYSKEARNTPKTVVQD